MTSQTSEVLRRQVQALESALERTRQQLLDANERADRATKSAVDAWTFARTIAKSGTPRG